ncbi:hypothetical protein [Aeromicrobium sp. CF3.5]|uniref:hypothetical protein n=1 Tax=Aeromicrobium sp. CF3.5 TaxID=3373078 RepID=UPI003EE4ADA3
MAPVLELSPEYLDAAATYSMEFPDDVELPSIADRLQAINDLEEGPTTFEEGFEESILAVVWRCGWERSLLEATQRGDNLARDRAGTQLLGSADEVLIERWVEDPDRIWEQEVLDPALAGDLEPLKADLVNSCGYPFVP